MILAQNHTGDELSRGLLRVADYVRNLDFPSRGEFVDDLLALSQLEAVLLVVAGVVFSLFGFKFFKLVVVLNAAAIGGLAGTYIGTQTTSSQNLPLLLGLAGAVLLGALAVPLVKYAVSLMAALAGGMLGYGVWRFVTQAVGRPELADRAWAGGVIGLIAVGMLAWIAFRAAVVIFTAVQGAAMFTSGLLSLAMNFESVREWLEPQLLDNMVLIYVLMGVPAALGFAFQESREVSQVKKKREATEKPPV